MAKFGRAAFLVAGMANGVLALTPALGATVANVFVAQPIRGP
jgi:hypothetical protein